MRAKLLLSGIVIAPLLLSANASPLSPAPEVKIGTRIANLSFKDIHYLTRTLDDFPKARVFVIAFTTTSCPVAQRYLPVLKGLDKEYRGKNVQFLSINEGPDDSIIDVASQAVQHDLEFPCVKDFDGKCASSLGVGRTAEVVVLDADRKIRYRGRIDDQYRLGGVRHPHAPRFSRSYRRRAGRQESGGCRDDGGRLPHHAQRTSFVQVAHVLRQRCGSPSAEALC